MKYTYLTRAEWGARTDLPRLGEAIDPNQATHAFIHHVVAIDHGDDSPNVWETDAECFGRMRGLQTARPDLGNDVPYSFVAFLREDHVLICEGRGAYRRGAHTQWHNVDGRAVSLYGNFQDYATFGLEKWLPAIGWFLHDLKMGNAIATTGGPALPNLGSVHPAGRDVFGHREATDPQGNNVSGGTSCPGRELFDRLQHIKIAPSTAPVEEEDDVKIIRPTNRPEQYALVGGKLIHVTSEYVLQKMGNPSHEVIDGADEIWGQPVEYPDGLPAVMRG